MIPVQKPRVVQRTREKHTVLDWMRAASSLVIGLEDISALLLPAFLGILGCFLSSSLVSEYGLVLSGMQ